MEMQTEDSSVPEAANATESRPDTDAEPTAPVQAPSPAKATAPARKSAPSSILTLNADSEVETQESREDTIWHESQNAYRTRKILTGILGGIEKNGRRRNHRCHLLQGNACGNPPLRR